MKDCVSLYCELTGTNPQSLPRAGTPFLAPEGRDFGLGCERELNGLVDEAMANFERVLGAKDKRGINSSTAVPKEKIIAGCIRQKEIQKICITKIMDSAGRPRATSQMSYWTKQVEMMGPQH